MTRLHEAIASWIERRDKASLRGLLLQLALDIDRLDHNTR